MTSSGRFPACSFTPMKDRILSCVRGLNTAIIAMAVFVVPVGCFIALLLLVVSMEEGGDTLSNLTMPLTEAVVLLTHGTGFTLGAVKLTLIPLLLTGLLVALIAQVTRRCGASLPGWVTGVLIWVAVSLVMAHATTLQLADSSGVIAGKTALVFTLGYALGGLPGSAGMATLLQWLRAHIARPLRQTISMGALIGGLLLAIACVTGLITVIVWIVLGHEDMALMFDRDGMEIGSRIVTTIAAVFWLPNIAIWAVAWCAGAGFAIGDIAEFTLWSGEGNGLPSLPVFALLPAAANPDWVRIAVQLILPAAAVLIALLTLLLPRGFHVRPPRHAGREDARQLALAMLYPAGAFCLAAAMLAVGGSILFALSNGGLGTGHLAHVGVVVMHATQAVARPAALGLSSAWLLIAVIMAAIWGLHWLLQSHHKEENR